MTVFPHTAKSLEINPVRRPSIKTTTGNISKRKRINSVFHAILLLCILFSFLMLFLLLKDVISNGMKFLNIDFLYKYTSRFPEQSGIRAAIAGTIYIIVLAAMLAFPIGTGAAIYLEEYAKKSKVSEFIKLNINNLAGIPAIVYGILGLTLYVRFFGFGRSIFAAALTMGTLILPIIIVAASEALKTVPKDLKEASYALGATKWQTISSVILPYSMPGILTGTILAVSRGIGEASPLVVIGGAAGIWFSPKSLLDGFTTLPLQIYTWSSQPKADFQMVAASGILVLLMVLFTINLAAIILRNKYQDRIRR